MVDTLTSFVDVMPNLESQSDNKKMHSSKTCKNPLIQMITSFDIVSNEFICAISSSLLIAESCEIKFKSRLSKLITITIQCTDNSNQASIS